MERVNLSWQFLYSGRANPSPDLATPRGDRRPAPRGQSPRVGRSDRLWQDDPGPANASGRRAVAWERNGPLGAEVGYQIRFDDVTSLGTRICFVTEGILLRWLQDDRTLPEVGAVLFDEFHERNLLSDVALALVKQLQQTQRPELKMVVMSATLDAAPVAEYLGNEGSAPVQSRPAAYGGNPAGTSLPTGPQLQLRAGGAPAGASLPTGPHLPLRAGAAPVLVSEGRSFPVEVRYLEHRDERPVTEQAADAVEHIVNTGDPGDILVFMPGMGEINATINALRAARTGERLALIPLHGELPPEEQDRAFAPNPLRKIVVATNVAETSVTKQMRVPRLVTSSKRI